MKKFYTVLAAATICASTCLGGDIAAISIDNPTNLKTTVSHSLTISSENLVRAKSLEQAPIARRAGAKTIAKPTSAADIEGIYCMYAYGAVGQQENASYQNLGPIQIKVTTGNNIEMGPFIYSGVTFAGTFDPASQTITIAKGQSAAADATTNMTLYEYRWSDGKDHDVVFNIDAENRVIYYEAPIDAEDYYDAVICLAKAGAPIGTTLYAQMFVIDNKYTNAIMAAAEFDEANNALTDPYYDYIWVENQDGKIAVTGFYGLGFDDTFFLTVDATAKTATATVSNDTDAPAEYFNLQGVRVANPQPGQLVIKRQGATVTKMIAR